MEQNENLIDLAKADFKTNRDSIVAYNELLQDWISTVN